MDPTSARIGESSLLEMLGACVGREADERETAIVVVGARDGHVERFERFPV